MDKRVVIIVIFLLTVLLNIYCNGTDDNSIVQRNYAFSDFDSILVDGTFRVRILESDIWDIHISSTHADLKNIKIRKNGNEFELIMLPGRDLMLPVPVVVITMPVLKKLTLFGSLQVEAGGFSSEEELQVLLSPGTFLNLSGIECSNADFYLNGPCELHAFLSAVTININSEGSSMIRMGGRAENLFLESEGRIRIDGSLMLVDNVNLILTGIGEVRITPDVRLQVKSSDKSVIYYSDKYMDEPVVNIGNAILKKY